MKRRRREDPKTCKRALRKQATASKQKQANKCKQATASKQKQAQASKSEQKHHAWSSGGSVLGSFWSPGGSFWGHFGAPETPFWNPERNLKPWVPSGRVQRGKSAQNAVLLTNSGGTRRPVLSQTELSQLPSAIQLCSHMISSS